MASLRLHLSQAKNRNFTMPAHQAAPITAIIYGASARIGPALDAIINELAINGCRLAGLVQRDRTRSGRSRCDMIMQDLTTAETVTISQDRGEGARGCRLDVDALLSAAERVLKALGTGPDLLIVNKFGKAECEGGGCRSLIAEAVAREIPVVVAVPYANLDAWRSFSGDIAAEYLLDSVPTSPPALCRHLGLTMLVQKATSLGDGFSASPLTDQ